MKHSAIGRAMIIRLESARDDIRATTIAVSARSVPPSPRQGPTISERIVSRVVVASDAFAILAVGAVAMRWDSSGADWHLEGLVVLLGALLGSNLLHLAGAHRFQQFGDLGFSIGRTLLGWLMTLGALLLATLVVEPINSSDGPWIAVWFSGSAVLLVTSRVVLHHQIKRWDRAGRIGEVVAVVGAGALAQRLLRSFNASAGGPRIFGVYDHHASSLPGRCMGHPIRGSIETLVRDVRTHGIDTVIVALPPDSEHLTVDTLNK